MLEEKKRELETTQSELTAEKQSLTGLQTQKTKMTADLQKVTTEFEKKQLSFMTDIQALEQKIAQMSTSTNKMTSDQGKVLQNKFVQKIAPLQIPMMIEDQAVIITVPLVKRKYEPAESIRSSRIGNLRVQSQNSLSNTLRSSTDALGQTGTSVPLVSS